MKKSDMISEELNTAIMYEKRLEKGISRGTPIGSRVWGGCSEDSDYDFIIYDDHLEDILNVAKAMELPIEILEGSSSSKEHKMYNERNVKMKYDNKIYNFISYSKKDLETVVIYVLPRMAEIPPKVVADKRVRVMIFNGLLDVFIGEKYNKLKGQGFNPLPIISANDDDIMF